MGFLQGLHGTLALVLFCALLFTEETGVPLPFAPGELTLLAAGLLISTGGLDPWIFPPAALLSCTAGSILGYGWASAIGERGITALATRLHQQKAVSRATGRIKSASPLTLAISRLIPGLRIYTTLVAGAARVGLGRFVLALVPATVLWEAVYVSLGALVGQPLVHLFGRVETLALQGAILIVMGVVIYVVIRRAPATTESGLIGMPRRLRLLFAVAVDAAIIGSIVSGMLAIGRRVFAIGANAGWLDLAATLFVVAVGYVVAARRGAGATVGELLLHTSWVGSTRQLTSHPIAWSRALLEGRGSADSISAAARLFAAIGDGTRLKLVLLMAEQPKTAQQLATQLALDETEVRRQIAVLTAAGAATPADGDGVPHYAVPASIQTLLGATLTELGSAASRQQNAPAG